MPPRRSDPARPRPRVRVRVEPLGDSAVLAELGTRLDTALNTRAIALAAALKKRRDVRQALAAHSSVTVQFNPEQVTHQAIGIYPLDSPGGWHLIGRTSVRLFLPDSDPPSLFRVGDRVKFFAAQA